MSRILERCANKRMKTFSAVGELKSFSVQQFYKNAAEVWASSPHLRSKSTAQESARENLRITTNRTAIAI